MWPRGVLAERIWLIWRAILVVEKLWKEIKRKGPCQLFMAPQFYLIAGLVSGRGPLFWESFFHVFILHFFNRKSNYFMSKAVVSNTNMVRNQTNSSLNLHSDTKACLTLHPPQQLINNCPRGAVSNGELMTAEWKGTSGNLISFIDYSVLKGHLDVLITAASR